MPIVNDIIEIISSYSEEDAMPFGDLYRDLKIGRGYSDLQIDEALEKMFQEEKLGKRGPELAPVYWLK